MNILLLEDDKTIALGISTYLKNKDYNITSKSNLGDTEDLDIKDYDLVILDVNLPDGSGFDYLEYIKSISDVPVLMLTVRDTEEDILRGFDLGAIEYVSKPFSMAVLEARIKNIFGCRKKDKILKVKDLVLDTDNDIASINGKVLALSRQEYQILEYLLKNEGLTCTRESLIDTVWYGDELIEDNTLTVTIKRLRQKLGEYKPHIKTIRGMGYRWE